MPLLYYWRPDNYYRDLDFGAGYNLNQANKILHSAALGDSLWAFTRNKLGTYALAAELIIKAKTSNPPNFRYGKYRVWGDIALSRYFKVSDQPDCEEIIRKFNIKANAIRLGQSFQGISAVRFISQNEHLILKKFAKDFPLEPRARILPEEKLEATLLLGDPKEIEQLIVDEKPGITKKRQEYLYQQAPKRNQNIVSDLQKMYHGRCQICLWNPAVDYQENLCHAHHIKWLSRGGDDDISNIILVCPNHHAAIHRIDAPLDFSDFAFDFRDHREKVQINLHLEA